MTPLFEAIRGIYTSGDLQSVRKRLLHSSAWHQGQFTAYGESQQSRLWINWLTNCGVSEIKPLGQVDNGAGKSALLLDIRPQKAQVPVTVMFCIEHNHTHIKTLDMVLDSATLRHSLGQSDEVFATWWPEPDPLIISDYDQQLHPHTAHASPQDFLPAEDQYTQLLERWWAIWQLMQLSNIWQLYDADAEIRLPGQNASHDTHALFRFSLALINRLSRHYCQLEEVIQDQEQSGCFVIKWYLEGDVSLQGKVTRVRLPLMSFLELSAHQLCREYMLFDQIAFDKQFPGVDLSLL